MSLIPLSIIISSEPVNHLKLREHSYVCANLDFWPSTKCDYGNCSWVEAGVMELDFDNTILNQAAEQLGAGFLIRVGGTLADHVEFDGSDLEHGGWGTCTCTDPDHPTEETCYFPDVGHGFPDGSFSGFGRACLTAKRLDMLMDFATRHRKQLVFDLSSEFGRERVGPLIWEGDWDPSNARELFNYIKQTGNEELFFGFELGNEVWGLLTGDAHFTPEQAAKDYATLKVELDDIFGKNEKKILTLSGNWEYYFMRQFSRLNTDWYGMAWHWYPLGAGSSNDVIPNINNPDFTQTIVKDRLEEIQFWRNRDVPSAELWMGETGGAFNSGQNTTTNTFMSHRWYLDQLGMFAKNGHSAYCRQTLIGGNYGLLQRDGDVVHVNPDFYGALLFHHIMGDAVKDVAIIDNDDATRNVHIYSHTTGSTGYTSILAINFYREQEVFIKDIDGELFDNISLWVVTADDDQDHDIFINGKQIVVEDGIIPDVLSMVEITTLPIHIPPKSYAFMTFRPF